MNYLTTEQVLFLHARLIQETGGSFGVRDIGLLKAAIARSQSTFDGDDLYPDLISKAAALLHSLIENHPYVDGNKRVGITAAGLFLEMNGMRLIASSKELEELALVGYASYVVEILDKFTYEEEENAAVFRLTADTLARLDRGGDSELVVRYYEIQLLELLGFRPQLHKCVVSEAEIKAEDQYFSAKLGGVVSPKHGKGLEGAMPVSMEALKYMRHFQRSSYQSATRATVAPKVQRELETLMQHYITYLLERGLNSPSFLRRVRRENTN